MTPAMQREQRTYRSLLARVGFVMADPEPMIPRLVRGCIALAFTACVLAVACSHCLADTVKGGELSYTTPAMKREATACRSLLTRITAVPADPEPILSRVQHEGANSDCLALGVTRGIL